MPINVDSASESTKTDAVATVKKAEQRMGIFHMFYCMSDDK